MQFIAECLVDDPPLWTPWSSEGGRVCGAAGLKVFLCDPKLLPGRQAFVGVHWLVKQTNEKMGIVTCTGMHSSLTAE